LCRAHLRLGDAIGGFFSADALYFVFEMRERANEHFFIIIQ
jgi:hypothetical protein